MLLSRLHIQIKTRMSFAVQKIFNLVRAYNKYMIKSSLVYRNVGIGNVGILVYATYAWAARGHLQPHVAVYAPTSPVRILQNQVVRARV